MAALLYLQITWTLLQVRLIVCNQLRLECRSIFNRVLNELMASLTQLLLILNSFLKQTLLYRHHQRLIHRVGCNCHLLLADIIIIQYYHLLVNLISGRPPILINVRNPKRFLAALLNLHSFLFKKLIHTVIVAGHWSFITSGQLVGTYWSMDWS